MLLYKYRGLSQLSHTLDLLVHERLYCAPYGELNDPFEGQFTSMFRGYTEHSPEQLDALVAGVPIGIQVMTRLQGDMPLICSLSRSMKDVRLWSLYAESHKGVVIEIDFSGIEENAREVCYVRELPHFDPIPSEGGQWPKPPPEEVLTKKTKHWDYEQEYRVLNPNPYFSVKGRIKRVLLGSRVSELHNSILHAACPRIPFYRTRLDHAKIEVMRDTTWEDMASLIKKN